MKRMTEEQRRQVEDNFNLVYHVLKGIPNAKNQWDDYVQAASEGLCKAALYFNLDYGCEFSTYAVPMIRGSVFRYHRDYESRLVRIPRKMIDAKQSAEIVWLDAPVSGSDNGNKPIDRYEMIENPGDVISQEDLIIFDVMSEYIEDKFSESFKKVYELRFKNGYTQVQTAASLGLSQAQISRIETKLRQKFKAAFAV